jgi:hypothetical protein
MPVPGGTEGGLGRLGDIGERTPWGRGTSDLPNRSRDRARKSGSPVLEQNPPPAEGSSIPHVEGRPIERRRRFVRMRKGSCRPLFAGETRTRSILTQSTGSVFTRREPITEALKADGSLTARAVEATNRKTGKKINSISRNARCFGRARSKSHLFFTRRGSSRPPSLAKSRLPETQLS